MNKFDFKLGIIVALIFSAGFLLNILQNKNQTINQLEQEKEQILIELDDALKIKSQKQKKSVKKRTKKIKYQGTIGLVIDDFGYRNDAVSEGFLGFKTPMTYAVIPGHQYSSLMGGEAKKFGFEVIIHMPMETHIITKGEEDFILMTSQSDEEITSRVNNAFKQIPQAVGMNNHQGSKATEDRRVMTAVGNVLKDKSKYFLDSRTTKNTIAEETMSLLGVSTARRKVFLDNSDNLNDINRQVDELANSAKKDGVAIGIGHVKENTLAVLKKRIPELEKSGYKFRFVSSLLH